MQYTVKAAARATGVAENTLRTWERRYGVPRPERAASGRRLYDEIDVALVRRMAAFIEAGLPAAEAAQAAVASTPAPAPPDSQREPPRRHALVPTFLSAAEAFHEARAARALQEA